MVRIADTVIQKFSLEHQRRFEGHVIEVEEDHFEGFPFGDSGSLLPFHLKSASARAFNGTPAGLPPRTPLSLARSRLRRATAGMNASRDFDPSRRTRLRVISRRLGRARQETARTARHKKKTLNIQPARAEARPRTMCMCGSAHCIVCDNVLASPWA